MKKVCRGCGAELQFTDPSKSGYIPQNKYEESYYCERCFRVIHYNEKRIAELDNINDEIITKVNKEANYVYFMLDFLNISEETLNTFKMIKVPKTLVISKVDIIPHSIKENNITKWLNEVYQITDNIIFQSSKKNINTKAIITNLESNNLQECYILGFTNAGKSTFINKICNIYAIKNHELTTSSMPNTTIGFITIPINKINIIDSPGFTFQNTIYTNEEFDLIKRISPKTFLKPITYQVKEISSIIIEDKIRINSSVKNSLTFYMSNDLNLERVFNDNSSLTSQYKIILEIPANSDLVIKSLGFINIKKQTTLTIYSNNPNLFEVRESLFND